MDLSCAAWSHSNDFSSLLNAFSIVFSNVKLISNGLSLREILAFKAWKPFFHNFSTLIFMSMLSHSFCFITSRPSVSKCQNKCVHSNFLNIHIFIKGRTFFTNSFKTLLINSQPSWFHKRLHLWKIKKSWFGLMSVTKSQEEEKRRWWQRSAWMVKN